METDSGSLANVDPANGPQQPQPLAPDPLAAHMLALLEEQKSAMAERMCAVDDLKSAMAEQKLAFSNWQSAQDKSLACLALLAANTQGLADRLNHMGSVFEKQIRKLQNEQKMQFGALERRLEQLEADIIVPPTSAPPVLTSTQLDFAGQSSFPFLVFLSLSLRLG